VVETDPTARDGEPRRPSVVAEESPGYGSEAQETRTQAAWLRAIGISFVVLSLGRPISVRREACRIPALVLGLVDLERKLIRIERTGCRLGLDRWPGVCRCTVQLWKRYWPFIDGHARTSGTVAG
jgi:hypothetical protein